MVIHTVATATSATTRTSESPLQKEYAKPREEAVTSLSVNTTTQRKPGGLAVYRFVLRHRTEQKHLRVRTKIRDVRCVMQSRVATTTTQFFSHTNPKVLFTFYRLLTIYTYIPYHTSKILVLYFSY